MFLMYVKVQEPVSQKYNHISQIFNGIWLNQKVRADLKLESLECLLVLLYGALLLGSRFTATAVQSGDFDGATKPRCYFIVGTEHSRHS